MRLSVVGFWCILVAFIALPVFCQGAVKGLCSDCHTMHNSQQGSAVAFSRDQSGQQVVTELPFAKLLKTDCVGCHSDPGSETIVPMGLGRIPIVFNLIEPSYPPNGTSSSTLAGGNFYWVSQGGDQYGHNIHGISDQDTRLGGGGWPRAEMLVLTHAPPAIGRWRRSSPAAMAVTCRSITPPVIMRSLARKKGGFASSAQSCKEVRSLDPPRTGSSVLRTPIGNRTPLPSGTTPTRGQPVPMAVTLIPDPLTRSVPVVMERSTVRPRLTRSGSATRLM